ncbi:MAG: asparagine synthase-related protein [Candidatus Bathyarchaeota archaeon]|nr:asparagine synthase-related protein [Candidatus Bathyarchaeum tardum]
MVNFVIVIDSNVNRRTLFIKTIKQYISPIQGLNVNTCSNGALSSIWTSGSWTPINHLNDKEGTATIWGDAIKQCGSQRISAKQLRLLWNNIFTKMPVSFDGFHVGFVYDHAKGLIVGADLLGLFPVFYYTSNDVLLVGSSPELFKFHTCFKTELNPLGLVGIFLTNGLVDGQTLLKGVKRLNAGHLLTWKFGEDPKELEQYQIPISTKYFDLSFSEQLNLLNRALNRAVVRHAPKGYRYCLSLSGGLDSRIIGGYLKQNAIETVALTMGSITDIEMRCARKVSSTLGFNQYKATVDFEKYLSCADRKVMWEHLSNGFSGLGTWSLSLNLRKLAPRVITGYLGDSILGAWLNNDSFEKNFEESNEWGFSPEILKKLLKHEVFDDFILDILARLKRNIFDIRN